MTIWVTSDQHFGHANIIKYCSRPFDSVWHMNTTLFSAWNDRVQDDDTVLQLGDLTFIKPTSEDNWILNAISTLKGKIVFVPGNHDKKQMVEFYARELRWVVKQEISITGLLFTHRPAGTQQFVTNVHGHTHMSPAQRVSHVKDKTFIDVGVDGTGDWGPVKLFDVVSPNEQIERAIHQLFTS